MEDIPPRSTFGGFDFEVSIVGYDSFMCYLKCTRKQLVPYEECCNLEEFEEIGSILYILFILKPTSFLQPYS